MKKHDLGSGLFWLLLSIIIFIESLHLGVGTVQNPGMGFMAFGASGLLGLLALILLFRTIFEEKEAETAPLFPKTLWKRVLILLITLVVYTRIMPVIGYLVSTFLLMAFLYWISEPKRVRWAFWSLVLSFLTTVTSYYVFSVLLNCQFPSGVFGL